MTRIGEKKLIPVLLSIRGEQYFDDADPDETELMTEGTLAISNQAMALFYEETELTGMEGTTTTFAVEDNVITLTRPGVVNSQLIFRDGKQHTSLY